MQQINIAMGYRLRGYNTPSFSSIEDAAEAFAVDHSAAPPSWNAQRTHRIVLARLDGYIERIVQKNTSPPHLIADNLVDVTIWNYVHHGCAETVRKWFLAFVDSKDGNNFTYTYYRPSIENKGDAIISGVLIHVDNTAGIPVRLILSEYLLPWPK